MSFPQYTSIADAPALDAIEITPGASPLSSVVRGLMAAGTGTATVITFRGNTVTIPLVAGAVVPIVCTHVTAATATGIVGLV